MGYENVKKKIAEYTIMIAVNREMIGDLLCSKSKKKKQQQKKSYLITY